MTLNLRTFLDSGKMVHLTRGFPGEPSHSGFVLGVGEELVILHQFHDFYSEGLTALRIEDIMGIEHGGREQFIEHILNCENIVTTNIHSIYIKSNNFKELISNACHLSQNLIIECENMETDDEDNFYIGKIISFGNDAIKMQNFDSVGVWDGFCVEIAYSDITKIQFDTPYLNIISRYLSPTGRFRDGDDEIGSASLN